ncbi:MAG: AbrB/MazE/SpoVT family DNA-binding domain-containing protein [Puniceicoccaceae bacterium]|nr:MAG: AbrB/MazE/SpoVT family DNA-binding domain-containing protein [Puniceicoccaceae bacterium]
MKTVIPLAKIGNSQGIRLSKKLIQRYRIQDKIEMETTPDGIIIRAPADTRLSWAATYEQMAREGEDFSDWEAVAEDGIDYES